MKTPTWHQIEEDIRIGFAMVADLVWQITGYDGRGEAAASSVLGVDQAPGYLLADRLNDKETLGTFAIENTEFYQMAKKAYQLVSPDQAIEDIDVSTSRVSTEQYLNYFIRAIPRDSVGAYEAPSVFQDPEAALPVLLAQCRAKLDLAEMVQELAVDFWPVALSGFTPADVAALGQMNLRTVRNHFGPKGDKAIKSYAIGGGAKRSDLVMGDPFDALEWLAGRRGFKIGGISTAWANEKIASLGNLDQICAFVGVFAWCNKVTTEEVAEKLGWDPKRFSSWVRSGTHDLDEVKAVASAVGLASVNHAFAIEKLRPN